MVVLSRGVGPLAVVLTGAVGARISRKRGGVDDGEPGGVAAFIAGVPVLNYDTAYGGGPHAQNDEQEWVVMLKFGTTKAQMQDMCSANTQGCNLVAPGGTPFVELRATEASLEAVLRAAGGAARYVEPDAEVAMIPEIPELQVDGVEAATWGLNRVGADVRGRAGAGATIYVLDTGVRVTHQEFSGRAMPVLDMTEGADPVECKDDLFCAGDRDGHGTHCAGTAAGRTLGVAPSAAVRAIKVLGDGGAGSWSWSYYALGWMAEQQVRPAVASMSLGGRGNQQAMVDAVNGAVNAGVTVVVAGGNDNVDACNFSPAFVPAAITIGSTTQMDVRSDFSNFGPCTDLWAPGSRIWSAAHTTDQAERLLSGTSMACPHVSGAAALLLEADPTLKASAVKQRLLDGAILDVLTDLRLGDTNALLYVGEGGPPPTPAPVPTPAPLCAPEYSTGPDWDNDCTCLTGLTCYENGTRGCTYSFTAQRGTKSDKFFSGGCPGCVCKRR